MRTSVVGLALVALGVALLSARASLAQQATVSTPFRQLNDSYFENMGTSWSLQGKGWYFNYGSPNSAAPQFGGFQPSAGANLGFSTMAGGVTGKFNANWSQGYRQSFVSQTPSVTLMNGATGYMMDSSVSPFVMGFVPVVGYYPGLGGPLGASLLPDYSRGMPDGSAMPSGSAAVQEALRRAKTASGGDARSALAEAQAENAGLPAKPAAAKSQQKQDDLILGGSGASESLNQPASRAAGLHASSAARAAASVAEARRLYAAEKASQDGEALKYMELARSAEEAGKPGTAKLYYQMAARRASNELKTQIQARLDDLNGKSAGDKR